jgi:FeS assembly SUF system protein
MFRLAALARHPAPAPDVATATTEGSLHDRVIAALRTVFDPEIPVNIYDLGLIYDLDVADSGAVAVRMTLTAPACPVAGTMPGLVESAVRGVQGVSDVRVDLVWDPPWGKDRMSDEAKLQLGML